LHDAFGSHSFRPLAKYRSFVKGKAFSSSFL
jgi:hypothetical protein